MFGVLRTIGLALGLLGGTVAAQGPEFAQQYAQRLGGATDELRRVVTTFERDAAATGASREAALDRLRASGDPLAVRRGEAAREDMERLKTLTEQQQALATASGPLGRMVALIRNPDLPLTRATYRDYAPAVPTTADGLIAGFLGFLATWGGWRVLSDVGRRLTRFRRAPSVA